MFKGSAWIGIVFGLMVAAGATAGTEKPHKYVGVKKCRSCHKKELMGNQYGAWLEGPHAKALETLKSDEALEYASELGLADPPHESADCLKCHVTAYDVDPSLIKKKPLAHSDGVQCESCHGPGSDYRKKKVMSDRDKAVAKGLWDPGEDAEICTACHNDESPGWDPAKGFDFEASKEEIAHSIPEDVKGRYLELEKKAKAEGRGEDDDEEEDDD